MSQLSIKLPAKLESKARQRANESGHASLESYVKSLVEADTAVEYLSADLEKLLLERLQDPRPSIEYNEGFKKKFLADMKQKIRRSRKSA